MRCERCSELNEQLTETIMKTEEPNVHGITASDVRAACAVLDKAPGPTSAYLVNEDIVVDLKDPHPLSVEPHPNDFYVATSLFNDDELNRLFRACYLLGYPVQNERFRDRSFIHTWIIGLKPGSDDAAALFELAEIEI